MDPLPPNSTASDQWLPTTSLTLLQRVVSDPLSQNLAILSTRKKSLAFYRNSATGNERMLQRLLRNDVFLKLNPIQV